jgi:hypothetical protein
MEVMRNDESEPPIGSEPRRTAYDQGHQGVFGVRGEPPLG